MVVQLQFKSHFPVNVSIDLPDGTSDIIVIAPEKPGYYYIKKGILPSKCIVTIGNAVIKLNDSALEHNFLIADTITYNEQNIKLDTSQLGKNLEANQKIISYLSPILKPAGSSKVLTSQKIYKIKITAESQLFKWEYNNKLITPFRGLEYIGTHVLNLIQKNAMNFNAKYNMMAGKTTMYNVSIPPEILRSSEYNIMVITDKSSIVVNDCIIYAKITSFDKYKQYFGLKSLNCICAQFEDGCSIVMHYDIDPVIESMDSEINITLKNSGSGDVVINDKNLGLGVVEEVKCRKTYFCLKFKYFECDFDVIIKSSGNFVIDFSKHDIFINGIALFTYMYSERLMINVDGRKAYFQLYYQKNTFTV